MVERKLHKLDATDKSLGRLASQIALILRGKNKPEFQPHLDLGDIVEVSNIKFVKFTGKKLDQKEYHHYSGYPGGLKTIKLKDLQAKDPTEALRRAVFEMLPDIRARKDIIKRLIIR